MVAQNGKRVDNMFCEHIRVKSIYPNTFLEEIPFYTNVKVGSVLPDGSMVTYIRPADNKQCLLVPTTIIEVMEYSEYRIEKLSSNYLVNIKYKSFGKENEQLYIYPTSVWEELEKRFLKPLSEGKPPREQGALLYGAEGTGKTSSAFLIADILGLSTISITQTKILSKWLGESEANLRSLLLQAEKLQPSLVLIDDAEWITLDREYLKEHQHQTMIALLDQLLGVIDRWKKQQQLVVTLLTTNLREEMIDKAFRRGGRLGRPIFIPVPDYEAVYEYMIRNGVDTAKAEKYAVKLVNAGLPMSDVAQITNDILNNIEPKIESRKGMGYRRQAPPFINKKLLEPLKYFSKKICAGLTDGSRMIFHGSSNLSLPILTTIIGIECKKSVIIATDPKMMSETINTVDTTNGVLIIPVEYIQYPDIIAWAFANTKKPIILTGTIETSQLRGIPPCASLGSIDTLLTPVSIRYSVAYIIKEFYNLPFTEKDLEQIKKLGESDFKRTIYNATLYHSDYKSIRNLSF